MKARIYKYSLILVIATLVHGAANGQHMALLSGSLKGLKGQSFNVSFNYDSMIIGDKVREVDYLAKKKSDWEAKEPGKGTAFVKAWLDAREARYEPAFIKFFERYARVKIKDQNARYTLIMKTKRTESGWSGGIVRHAGVVEGELWIVESNNPNKVLATIGFVNLHGKVGYGGDFQLATNIESAYEFAGKALGDFVRRKAR